MNSIDIILRAIQTNNGPISQPELMKKTHYSDSTISDVIAKLMQLKHIAELPRPPTGRRHGIVYYIALSSVTRLSADPTQKYSNNGAKMISFTYCLQHRIAMICPVCQKKVLPRAALDGVRYFKKSQFIELQDRIIFHHRECKSGVKLGGKSKNVTQSVY